jgi:hypothetical protein
MRFLIDENLSPTLADLARESPYRDHRALGTRAGIRARRLGILRHWVAALQKVIDERGLLTTTTSIPNFHH